MEKHNTEKAQEISVNITFHCDLLLVFLLWLLLLFGSGDSPLCALSYIPKPLIFCFVLFLQGKFVCSFVCFLRPIYI